MLQFPMHAPVPLQGNASLVYYRTSSAYKKKYMQQSAQPEPTVLPKLGHFRRTALFLVE